MTPITKSTAALALAAALAAPSAHAALTSSYISHNGAGSGQVQGDMDAVGSVTLYDAAETGDLWTGGDQAQYLHTPSKLTGDFSAVVRYMGSTEAIDGSWGKGGIMARQSLAGDENFSGVQIAQGNGSQPGGANPVPVRQAGRWGAIGDMFEDPITFTVGGGDVPNDISQPQWLRLDYDSGANAFTAGWADDVAGAPGIWNFSAPRTDIQNDGSGWYLGLYYSAHENLNEAQITDPTGLHGAVFEQFSFIPEPGSATLFGLGAAGLLAFRRRRRG